jgi:hypothetical protein
MNHSAKTQEFTEEEAAAVLAAGDDPLVKIHR